MKFRNNRTTPSKTFNRYKLITIKDRFTNPTLLTEVSRRKLSKDLVSTYLKQGQIEDRFTGKKHWAFLFENDKGGYAVSIPVPNSEICLTTHVGLQASSRILLDDSKNSADVFYDFWDFLVWQRLKGRVKPANHSYILNGYSKIDEVCNNIAAFQEVIRYVFLFMPNTEEGYRATHSIAAMLEESVIKVGSLEQFYFGFKNLNDFVQRK